MAVYGCPLLAALWGQPLSAHHGGSPKRRRSWVGACCTRVGWQLRLGGLKAARLAPPTRRPARSFDGFARRTCAAQCPLQRTPTRPAVLNPCSNPCSFDEFTRMSLDNVFLAGKLDEYREAFR